MRPQTAFLILLIAVLGTAIGACSGSDQQPDANDLADQGSGSGTANNTDLPRADIQNAADLSGLDAGRFEQTERSDEGLIVSLIGPKILEIGTTGWYSIRLTNSSENFKPEKPFSISQTSGQIIPGGPISVDSVKPASIRQSITLAPDDSESALVQLTCQSEGAASLTFQSVGQSDIESPATGYSTTIAHDFECVEDDDDPLTGANFAGLTDGQLGFPASTLTWVTFTQGGVVLRVNQIEPVELTVGETVEIYADFDGREAGAYTGLSAGPNRLIDASLDFTSGGPVSIDSPPRREADAASLIFDGDPIAFWGFRSGTLECTTVGEGVYHANLRGKRFNGEVVLQTVTGLVDCVESTEGSGSGLLADELDFSGVWARRPNSEGAYTPTNRDDFPSNTELYFDYQICVARISGIRSCDIAYWTYGADWFELTKTSAAERVNDSFGNELFVTDYSGVYHHTHSYFGETKLPDELLRDGKTWGDEWDLSAGPVVSTFEISGTITFIPGADFPLHVSLQGEHQGPLKYTHTTKINLSYAGPILESGGLPVRVNYSEEVRADLHAPEGLRRGTDPAIGDTFFSASTHTDGIVAGRVRPASAAEKVDRATVEIFIPGEDTPIGTTGIDANGGFIFTDLPVIRTDLSTSGVSDVFATQYTLKISEGESEVDGNPLLFQTRTLTVRPFTDDTIFLEPIPATHFIAVGDRGVGGAPIVFHYSLEYWVCGGRFEPLHDSDGFTPQEIVGKCQELNPRARPQKLGEVELLARMDWTVWAGVDDLVGSGRSWIEQGVWIAEIVYEGVSATDLMPIFAGTEEEVGEKWTEIIELAETYPWAEQSGFAGGNTFTQWPVSMYASLGTNSNTFIRFLVTTSGLRMTEMDGLHPGHIIPIQNTESDLGRQLSFYPEHTPWFGSAAKPEPAAPPP